MTVLKLKGNIFDVSFLRTVSIRHVTLFRNQIFTSLRKLGIPEHHVKIRPDLIPTKKMGAEVHWYFDGHNCHYDYHRQERYVDNLQVISKLLSIEVEKVLNKEKAADEFVFDFREDDELVQKRKEARALLGLSENEMDLEVIDKQFKLLAKEAHPDMPGGNTERFKQLNEAHKLLKKELE